VLNLLHSRGALQVGSDRGVVSLSSNRRSFHDELVETVWTPFLFSLVLNPRRSSNTWIEPFCLFGVLVPFLRFPLLLWRVDQRKMNPVSFPAFLVLRV